VEYARDTAQKFNRIFGDTFKIPEPYILKEVETVPGTDGKKMSKSNGNIIPLFATDEEIKKAVMSIPTDSKGVAEPKNPDESIVFQIHKLLLDDKKLTDLRAKYEKGGLGYKEAKELLIADLRAFIRPLRVKREMFSHNLSSVLKILKKGGEKARSRAEAKMQEVREKVGVNLTRKSK
jgi:tryptophanyl-tRNA synthetase